MPHVWACKFDSTQQCVGTSGVAGPYPQGWPKYRYVELLGCTWTQHSLEVGWRALALTGDVASLDFFICIQDCLRLCLNKKILHYIFYKELMCKHTFDYSRWMQYCLEKNEKKTRGYSTRLIHEGINTVTK